VQRILGGPEFTNWESKIYVRSSPVPSQRTKILGKCRTLHTKKARERYLLSKVYLAGWLAEEKKWHKQLLSVDLALSSIWEKARARDKERWQEIRDSGALFCKG
jgi:hypothetical protein